MHELNHRIPEPVSVDNFRPNLVVSGCRPWEEDTWKSIRVGELIFDIVKPCGRCAVPTVNPATGKHNQAFEPIRELRTYRQLDDLVYVGQLMIQRQPGENAAQP